MHEHEYTVWAACQHHHSVEIGLGCCLLIPLARRGKAKQINLKWRSKVKEILNVDELYYHYSVYMEFPTH